MLVKIYTKASKQGKSFINRLLNVLHCNCKNCGCPNNIIPDEPCIDCDQNWITKKRLDIMTWHAVTEYEFELDYQEDYKPESKKFTYNNVIEFYDIAHKLGYYRPSIEDEYTEDERSIMIQEHLDFLEKHTKFEVNFDE